VHHPDDQIEAYLKKFQPVIPDPLPGLEHTRELRRLPRLPAWIAALAVLTIVGVLALRVRDPKTDVPRVSRALPSEAGVPLGPLTQQKANEWLVRTPSLNAAVDDLAFRYQNSALQPGEQSAVAVLSEERIKL
jgi:hypothetical protein